MISRIFAVSLSTRFCGYPHFTVEKTKTWSGKATCQHPQLFTAQPPSPVYFRFPGPQCPPEQSPPRRAGFLASGLLLSSFAATWAQISLPLRAHPPMEDFSCSEGRCHLLVGRSLLMCHLLFYTVSLPSSQEHEQDPGPSLPEPLLPPTF